MCSACRSKSSATSLRRLSCSGLVVLLVALGGCSDASLNALVQKVLQPKRTPQQYMLIAVSEKDPDLRRKAVAKVAESDQLDSEWAIKGLTAIALLEDDPQTRCVAIRALGRIDDPRALQTLLKILNYQDYPAGQVRPPDDVCRWDAAGVLADLTLAGRVPPGQRDAVRKTLLRLLARDPDRNVRVAAARGLAAFRDVDVVRALIDGLEDEDFAVCWQCEDSLRKLTGCSNDAEAYAWRVWLEQNADDPFAQADRQPAGDENPGPLKRIWRGMRGLFRWFVPPKKAS